MAKNPRNANYALLLFGLAAVAWSLGTLLAINTSVSILFAITITVLASATAVSGLVHFWRYA